METLPPDPLPFSAAAPEARVAQTTTQPASTVQTPSPPSWLHSHVRNIILLAVTGTVVYLALLDVGEARSVITTTFTGLASYLFAERASLKIPGKSA